MQLLNNGNQVWLRDRDGKRDLPRERNRGGGDRYWKQ